jgi:DNA-binding NtrC family response regulator
MIKTIPILVVEDEAILLVDVEVTLEEGGYTVLAAANAKEALAFIDSELGEIRALVTDIDIAGGEITGWDIAQRAREGKPDLPVVYMSGASSQDWASRGVPNSVMLAKPFAAAQLTTAVSQLLNVASELPVNQ